MAEKRMFSKAIADSDHFLDMPLSTQALYFHFGLRADDDGFIASPRRILKTIGASDDDLRLLIMKGYIITFESGIVVVTHWRINNNIRKDRYKPTIYRDEFANLTIDNSKYYLGIPIDNQRYTKGRLDKVRVVKDSIGEGSKGEETFFPPTLEEVRVFCKDNGIDIDCDKFYNHYEAVGWSINGTPMTNWKARVKSWYKEDVKRQGCGNESYVAHNVHKNAFVDYSQKTYTDAEIQAIEKRKLRQQNHNYTDEEICEEFEKFGLNLPDELMQHDE